MSVLNCGCRVFCGLHRKYFIPFARHFKGPGDGEPLKPLNVALAMARQNILVSIVIWHCFSHSKWQGFGVAIKMQFKIFLGIPRPCFSLPFLSTEGKDVHG